jgi:hypothetical protein
MIHKLTKFLCYVVCAGFLALAILFYFSSGFDYKVIICIVVAILSYEFADYLDYVKTKTAREARETEPCLFCRATGRVKGRKCPRCKGKGYRIAPQDTSRPPIS